MIGVLMTYKLRQQNIFPAVDYPPIASNYMTLPLKDEMEIAVIEYDGVTKCYPLDYVIHKHIINDRFNDKTISLTYCAMCRSIIPFNVTNIGPLFVASFKHANMIVADKKTKTFFQQANFNSVIGKLHPCELEAIPYQILTWNEVKNNITNPEVVNIKSEDLKAFELPIPGIWNKIISSELTPGLSKKNKDKSFPARTRVIGVIDKSFTQNIAFLKKEIVEKVIVNNVEYGIVLIAQSNTITAFRNTMGGAALDLKLVNNVITDLTSNTSWNIRGKYISGTVNQDLELITITDEYWFAWKRFHKESILVRL